MTGDKMATPFCVIDWLTGEATTLTQTSNDQLHVSNEAIDVYFVK